MLLPQSKQDFIRVWVSVEVPSDPLGSIIKMGLARGTSKAETERLTGRAGVSGCGFCFSGLGLSNN